MEVLLQEPIDLEQVADLCAVGIKRPPPTPRDHAHYHVTNLLESAKLIVKGDIRYFEGDSVSGVMSLGRIWEAAVDCFLTSYAALHGGFYIPDSERIEEGIIASLDGVILLPKIAPNLMVAETKLRFSLKGDIPLKHIQQVRAYCHFAHTDLVCYVVGRLSSTPPTAQAMMTVLRMTQASIDETWEGILNTKKYLESKGCVPKAVA